MRISIKMQREKNGSELKITNIQWDKVDLKTCLYVLTVW